MALARSRLLARLSSIQISSFSATTFKEGHIGMCTAAQTTRDKMKPKYLIQSLLQSLTENKKSMTGTYQETPPKPDLQPQGRSALIPEANSICGVIFQCLHLNPSVSSSSRFEDAKSYKCPSLHTGDDSNKIILDNVTGITGSYECPVSSQVDIMKAPCRHKREVREMPGTSSPAKEAKIIMRIRHKKMKKHQRKKLLKRMYYVWRKKKMLRKKKKMAAYFSELEEIKKIGEVFSAESFVKEQLEKARKGGYGLNVFDPKAGH